MQKSTSFGGSEVRRRRLGRRERHSRPPRRSLLQIGAVLALVIAVTSATVAAPQPARAAEQSAPAEFAVGTGAVLATVFWGTAKFLYAVGGTITGGFAWAFTGGRNDVAQSIIQPAVRGDYVVTPDHLMGRRPISFAGRQPGRDPYPYE